MGITIVTARVRNFDQPQIEVSEEFLVDSGAQYTVLPEKTVRKLKLQPKRKERFSLADGKIIQRTMSDCMIKYGNREVPTQVVLGEDDDTALFGVMTLEAMGLMLDPLSHKLRKMTLRM